MGKKETPKRRQNSPNRVRDDLVFKALANVDRRDILDHIRDAPKSTGQLCEAIPRLDRCTVMLHLKMLAAAELVIAKRQGRIRWNYLNVEPIQRVYDRWIRDYAQPAAELLTKLKDQLEAD